jgi:hypothetical protein
VEGGWRMLHNEEVHNPYCSTNIIRVMKWRKMRWAGHVACMRDEKCTRSSGRKIWEEETTRKN